MNGGRTVRSLERRVMVVVVVLVVMERRRIIFSFLHDFVQTTMAA